MQGWRLTTSTQSSSQVIALWDLFHLWLRRLTGFLRPNLLQESRNSLISGARERTCRDLPRSEWNPWSSSRTRVARCPGEPWIEGQKWMSLMLVKTARERVVVDAYGWILGLLQAARRKRVMIAYDYDSDWLWMVVMIPVHYSYSTRRRRIRRFRFRVSDLQDSQKHLNAMDLRLAALQGATGEWGNPAAGFVANCLFVSVPTWNGWESDQQKGTA